MIMAKSLMKILIIYKSLLPIKKMVAAWSAIHEDEIKAAWTAWNESNEIIKIEGLR